MFSKMGLRVVAAVVAMTLLTSCAEFDRRGGVVAEIEDYVLFTAHTKSHRLFRSYLLVGALLAAARQGAHNEADKAAIEGNLKTALDVASEAYACLYPNPGDKIVVVGLTAATTKDNAVAAINTPLAVAFTPPVICQFFDEKMARLDYALFRLALSTIFNAQSNVYLAEIRDKLMGKIPVLSSTAKAAIYANKAVNETTSVIDDLLNLSFSSAGPVLTLLPLYRDSLELNMWLIIDNLTRACRAGVTSTTDPYYDIVTDEGVCKTLGYAQYIMNYGNGDLRAWRDFVRKMNYATLNFEAYIPHFFLVTRLMWQTCQSLFGDTTRYVASPGSLDPKANKCQIMLTSAIAQNGLQQAFIQGDGGRIYSAAIRSPIRYARQPVQTPAQVTTAPALPPTSSKEGAAPVAHEPEATGSIGQPKGPASPPR